MYKTLFDYNPTLYTVRSSYNFANLRPKILNEIIPINTNIGFALITHFDFCDETKIHCFIDFKIISIDDKFLYGAGFAIHGPRFSNSDNTKVMLVLAFRGD